MPVASATRELPSVGFFVDILYEVGEVPLYSWFTQWSWGADSSFFLVIASLKIRIPLHITHLKCTIHFFFCIFEELCNHQYNFRIFPTAWKSSRYSLAVVLPLSLPLPARGEADPLSVPWGLLILDICWFHINGIIPHVGWPVWLLSLGVVFSRLVVLQPVLTLHSFLSWVACAIVWWRHVFVHPFFGQWTVGLFPFWFSWTVILWTQKTSFVFSFLLGTYLGVGLLACCVLTLCWALWGTATFSTVSASSCFPPAECGGSRFPILVNTHQPSWWVESGMSLWCCLALPWGFMVKSIFSFA